ncbi:MAG: V-type ATP synthase subunit A [Candidatus Thermoplasmatota archaeon]|nr:V-type ATP synthase subunit A [Candidatus Thermoplasmatota archaeon]
MGKIVKVSGPVIDGEDVKNAKMFDVVRVGEMGLVGEIIRIVGNVATIQVYEDTSGIKPGENIENTGLPLSVELGPGLLTSIYDGIQRPLDVLRTMSGDFITRGLTAPPLDRKKKWHFTPLVKKGEDVTPGTVLGQVQETDLILHKVMVPLGTSGTISSISEGDFTVDEEIGKLKSGNKTIPLMMMQTWPVRQSRKVLGKLPPAEPLITGQRVIDSLFPVAKGGTVAVPGPFGSGKCVTGDTPVLLGDGSLIEIKDLFMKHSENALRSVSGDEEVLYLQKPVELFSFHNGKIVKSQSSLLYKGKSSSVVKIRTKGGREVRVTPVHKLFRVRSDGSIVETKASDLAVGDFIAAALHTRFERKLETVNPESVNTTKQAEFTNILDAGILTSEGKIPDIVMSSGDDVISSFIAAYFAAFGSIENNIASLKAAGKWVSAQISYMLTGYGIMHETTLIKSGDSVAYEILISEPASFTSFMEIIKHDIQRNKTFSVSIQEIGSRGTGINDDSLLHTEEHFLSGITGKNVFHEITTCDDTAGGQTRTILDYDVISDLSSRDSQIFADAISEISTEDGTVDVYDLSVPEFGQNFVGGYGGLILHNTVVQHQLSKWADSDIVVYVGCGERGNEMTEILTTFPELLDPKSGKPLMERTVLIANTSNMPVAAREASIYTGISIAEYYRDMGYNIALMADSTSRWAEALREISGRLEEMPGEEGYPAYLGRRLSEFYERSGFAIVQSPEKRKGSITLVGAVSPPGGDISEPVSQNTLRVTRVFWALDASLASRRHFPSINWLNSYSLYKNDLVPWYSKNVAEDWNSVYSDAMSLLQKESELQEIVQLVGYDALPEKEKSVLDIARMIREDFLQQSAFDDIDTYCSLDKQYRMLKSIIELGKKQEKAIDKGNTMDQLQRLPSRSKISRMKEVKENDVKDFFNSLWKEMDSDFSAILGGEQIAAS